MTSQSAARPGAPRLSASSERCRQYGPPNRAWIAAVGLAADHHRVRGERGGWYRAESRGSVSVSVQGQDNSCDCPSFAMGFSSDPESYASPLT